MFNFSRITNAFSRFIRQPAKSGLTQGKLAMLNGGASPMMRSMSMDMWLADNTQRTVHTHGGRLPRPTGEQHVVDFVNEATAFQALRRKASMPTAPVPAMPAVRRSASVASTVSAMTDIYGASDVSSI